MKEKFLLLIVLLISLFLNIYGIWGGIPSKEKANLVFSNTQHIKSLSKIMREERDKLYEKIDRYFVRGDYGVKDIYNRVTLINGKEVEIPNFHIHVSRSHLLRAYPDEQFVLKALSNMNPQQLDFNPYCFIYGGIYIYLIGVCVKIASLLKIFHLTPDITYYFLHPEELGRFYIIGRCVGALSGVLAIYIIYLIGKLLYDKRTGFLAALFLSVMPASVIYAHYLKPYVFNITWFLLSLYYSCKILKEEKISNYLLAGLFAGISCGILLPFGAIFILIPIAHLIKCISSNKKNPIFLFEKNIIFSFALAIIGFIIVNPYILISLKEAIGDYTFLAERHKFNLSLKNILFYSKVNLPAGMGWPLLFIVIIGILYSLYKREKKDLFLLSFIFPSFFYITATTSYRSIHYGIWVLPFFILVASRVLGVGLNKRGIIKYITGIIVLFVFLYTFLYSFAYDRIFAGKDIKTEAGKWIEENIREGSLIGFCKEYLTSFIYPPVNIVKYKITYIEEGKKIDPLPEYFIESELCQLSHDLRVFLSSHYDEIKKFEKLPAVFGIKFNYAYSKMPRELEWWKIPNPTIIIYKLKQNIKTPIM